MILLLRVRLRYRQRVAAKVIWPAPLSAEFALPLLAAAARISRLQPWEFMSDPACASLGVPVKESPVLPAAHDAFENMVENVSQIPPH